ncbi:MAG: MetQ/NlpA family ABC transporter substrate-binding protein [Clostridiales bacterium]|nr:MetQ/NlpA family ABC transporter substrate-binding protein [Clostridiales bacterium]
MAPSSSSSTEDTSDSAETVTEASAEAETEASDSDTTELEPLVVGAVVTPHAEILEYIRDDLAEAGYDLQIVEYNDYVLPNTALEDGELDANYFQHQPYLTDFNEENGTHIVGVANIHFEPMAIYAGKTASLDELQDGAIVAVPNDTTNEARALLLLEANGLITLDEDDGLQATVLDIVENPLNLEIEELEAAQVPRAIEDVDIAVINGNYAIEAGLTENIAVEASDSEAAETYANIIAVREGDEDTEKTQALVNAMLTDKVRDFINDNYSGAVLPVF